MEKAIIKHYKRKANQSEVLNMISTIPIRAKNKLNIKSEILFKDSDADTAKAQYAPMTEKEILAKLEKSREQGRFRDADDVISDMRSKYGL